MSLPLATTADAVIARVLFVKGQPVPQLAQRDAIAHRALSASLLFSATRCILMYVMLPFVLPLFGLVGRAPLPLLMACDLVALGDIIYSLRRLWRLHTPMRWRYLPLACTSLLVMAVFLGADVASMRV